MQEKVEKTEKTIIIKDQILPYIPQELDEEIS